MQIANRPKAKQKSPLILVSNDDGIHAEGLVILCKHLAKVGQIIVVAPEVECSAVGHAITVSMPLKVNRIQFPMGIEAYSVNGTPADCVKIALSRILKRKPSLVVSGINLGSNLGIDALYSGTVSAATEAVVFGIRAFAVSLATFTNPDFSVAAKFAVKLARAIISRPLRTNAVLNVNVPGLPHDRIKGVKIVPQSLVCYKEKYEKRTNPRDETYYWLTGEIKQEKRKGETDLTAVRNGYIAITPLTTDLTHLEGLEELKKWNFEY
jgi:5'-nucleotidase